MLTSDKWSDSKAIHEEIVQVFTASEKLSHNVHVWSHLSCCINHILNQKKKKKENS